MLTYLHKFCVTKIFLIYNERLNLPYFHRYAQFFSKNLASKRRSSNHTLYSSAILQKIVFIALILKVEIPTAILSILYFLIEIAKSVANIIAKYKNLNVVLRRYCFQCMENSLAFIWNAREAYVPKNPRSSRKNSGLVYVIHKFLTIIP